MTATEISTILGILGTLATLAEKYGPEVYETVKSAIDSTLNKNGPSADELRAIYEKCKEDNDKIQNS